MIRRLLIALLLLMITAGMLQAVRVAPAAVQAAGPGWTPPPSTGDCRFGTTFSYWGRPLRDKISRYDFPLVGFGYYLDYTHTRDASVPAHIKYLHVLRVSNGAFNAEQAGLAALVVANPGSMWIVGNEPEMWAEDAVTAEVYAERYFALAQIIRAGDATARIGFGPIVMPTVLRMKYIDFAWKRLIQLAGSHTAAAALIDMFVPHGFILNEQGGLDENGNPFWGSGVPYGFETRIPPISWQAEQELITDFSDLYSFEKFKIRMLRFRQWMKDSGLQNKALWLTEYGQLAPPYTRPEDNFYTVPEAITADFFAKTTDWMLQTKDASLGMPTDGNRLFQKWFWYSVNDPMTHYGGTLVNPDTLKLTFVGGVWLNFIPADPTSITYTNPDLYPLSIQPLSAQKDLAHPGRYILHVNVRVRNAIIADHFVDATVTAKIGGTSVAAKTGKVARCGGDAVITLSLPDMPNNQATNVCFSVDLFRTTPYLTADINPSNNTLCIPLKFLTIYMPAIIR